MQPETTHFGYQNVPLQQKQGMVNEVFASVASKYDIMNDVMSGGLHRVWKEHFVRQLRLRKDMQILDLAGGTGDIASSILRHAAKRNIPNIQITVGDINEAMLAEGQRRALDKNIHGLTWQVANAEALPFADHSMDACTMAFGIRNVPNVAKAVQEVFRVLKPGGQFLCLEFSPSQPAWVKPVYDAYSFKLIPWFGEKITGDKAAYQYLVESIRQFPTPEAFAQMWQESGFSRVRFETMTLGVVAIHSGWKI